MNRLMAENIFENQSKGVDKGKDIMYNYDTLGLIMMFYVNKFSKPVNFLIVRVVQWTKKEKTN